MPDDYTAGWKRRVNADKARRSKQAQDAAIAARNCARTLYEKYGVYKVYLFGSLVKPETFHHESDIDLVVEGLSPNLYFKALAELWRLLPTGMELDLIPLEDADSELRKRVVKEGVTLGG
jgi:uncharacterized protein